MLSNKSLPILSVCIPTYNRGKHLSKLLEQIYSLNKATKSRIEICISDNFSSDNTPHIINNWQSKLEIVSVRQKTNIGASRNFQAAAALSSAPWVVLMGDDDLFIEQGIKSLLDLLEKANPNTWVFANILNQDGTSLLQKIPQGHLPKWKFKKEILLNSLLNSLGFMSMHVIPRSSIHKFTSLSLEEIYGWPHLAALFYDLFNIQIFVENESIVIRGGAGEEVTQTWRSNDWLRLMMQKTMLCCYSEKGRNTFSTSLAMREYFSWPYIRQTFHAMIVLGGRGDLFCQAKRYINATNAHGLSRAAIKMYVFLLLLFPAKMILLIRKLKKPGAVEIIQSQKVNSLTDGMDRGL